MAEKIGSGLTMFILDDEKDISHFSKLIFVRRGFNVHAALTVQAAINTIKKVNPDIALLDIRLNTKGMDGMDVLKFIREKRPECRCIMVTYVDDQKLVDQAMQLGAVGYLRKPLTLAELEKAINKVVKNIRKSRKGGK